MRDPSNEVLLRIRLDEANTPAKLAQLQRDTKKVWETQITGSREATRAEKEYHTVANKNAQVRQAILTDNGKMMRSYFQLGQQLRQNKFAVLELAQASGMDKHGLGGVFMAFTGPGGLLAGMIAGVTALGVAAFNSAAKAKELRLELIELQGGKTAALVERLTEAKGRTIVGTGWKGIGIGPLLGLIYGEEEKLQQQADVTKIEQALGADTARYVKEAQEKRTADRIAAWLASQEVVALKARPSTAAEWRAKQEEMFVRSQSQLQAGERVAGTRGRQQFYGPEDVEMYKKLAGPNIGEQGFGDLGAKGKETMNQIRDGAIEAGSAISQYIGGALRASLSTGENLALTIFGIAIRTALIASGNAKFAGIVPFASGGSFVSGGGGFVPMRGGGMAMVHPNERIDVTPMRDARMSRGGGGSQRFEFGEVAIRHDVLAVSVKKGNQTLGNRAV